MGRIIEELEKELNNIRILIQQNESDYIRFLIQQAENEYENIIKRENLKKYIQLDEIQEVLIEYRQSKLGKERFEKNRKYNQQYNKYYQHSEKGKEFHKRYYQSEKYKKHQSMRRQLGFVSLNSRFEGSEAHHLDEEKVLYIPKKLHRSLYHDVFTGKNMSEINNKALEWFKNQSEC